MRRKQVIIAVAVGIQGIAIAVLIVLMARASDRIAGAYAWAQLVPVGLFAALTIGTGVWALKAVSPTAWITGLISHLVALLIYAVWVFFWTFVFGMDKRAGDFIDNSITFGVLYSLGLIVIAILFVGAQPDKNTEKDTHA